jgi:hypothetical protein
VETALQALEGAGFAQYFRSARWGYAALNAGHILGFALLVGAIVPLDLRLLGFWRSVERASLVRVLVPTAAAGLALAVIAGLLLFSVRAGEYADLAVFRVKLALILAGVIAALLAHLRHGFLLQVASDATLRRHALLSMVCWLGALVCGRLIAFMGD